MHVKTQGEEADKELAPVPDNSIAWGDLVASRTNLEVPACQIALRSERW